MSALGPQRRIPTRRVVTGHDADGNAAVLSDATLPWVQELHGAQVVEHLRFPASSRHDRGAGPETDLPPGGGSFRVQRVPVPALDAPEDDRWVRVPGFTAQTLDCVVVLDGELTLRLDDGTSRLSAGEVVVLRGTPARARASGDGPCTFGVLSLRPEPAATIGSSLVPRTDAPGVVRRVVTGRDSADRSRIDCDGDAPVVQPESAAGLTEWTTTWVTDLWQTGGPLRRADQGGDAAAWEHLPRGGGTSCHVVYNPPGTISSWHATPTVDVNFVLGGSLQLELPECDPVVLGPGDVAIQGGTQHRWLAVSDEPVRWFAVMISDGLLAAR